MIAQNHISAPRLQTRIAVVQPCRRKLRRLEALHRENGAWIRRRLRLLRGNSARREKYAQTKPKYESSSHSPCWTYREDFWLSDSTGEIRKIYLFGIYTLLA